MRSLCAQCSSILLRFSLGFKGMCSDSAVVVSCLNLIKISVGIKMSREKSRRSHPWLWFKHQ